MIALSISSIISIFLFTVFGISITKLMNIKIIFTEKILVGLVVANTLSTISSLFIPLNIYSLIGFILLNLILIFYIKDELRIYISQLKKKKVIILSMIPFVIVGFIVALNSPHNYDTGLYHLQSIKWIEEYPVVPGLANLHSRFGFNPNIFTLFALTSLSDLFNQEIFSINFTLFSIFVFYFINKLSLIFKEQGISNLFIFNLIVFFTILGLPNLSSPSPDYISVTFPMFLLTRILSKGEFNNNNLKSYIPILILSVYAITVKLATLPILLLSIFIFIKYIKDTKKLLWIITLLSIIIIPWLLRNIILTGWLIYPISFLDLFSFDWQVPVASLKSMNVAITGWARNPGKYYRDAYEMNIFEWFPIWWGHLARTNKLYLLASLFFPIITFIAYLLKKIKLDLYTLTVILTSFLGVLFILVFAPNFRFGKSFITIATLTPLLFLKFKIEIKWKPFYKPIYTFIIILIILFYNFNSIGYNPIRIAKENYHRLVIPDIIKKPEKVNFKTFFISDTVIYIPTEGDRCFDKCIPCTPYPNKNIELRKGTLQHGFKIVKNEK